jgi:hypothetical protein
VVSLISFPAFYISTAPLDVLVPDSGVLRTWAVAAFSSVGRRTWAKFPYGFGTIGLLEV